MRARHKRFFDPRDNRIFYIVNGKGDHVYQHARHAKKVGAETRAELKLGRIQEIHRAIVSFES
jgi:hypothetical protein